MVHLLSINGLSDLPGMRVDPALPAFDPSVCRHHRCDAHIVAEESSLITARCSLWWTEVPGLPGEKVGVIGHYSDASSNAAREVLEAACARLREQGCTLALGPMDGNTWRRYRFITGRTDEPAFFLEPDNPVAWPENWRAAHFQPLAAYFSGLVEDLSCDDPQVTRAGERLKGSGVVIRPLNPAAFKAELQIIYDLSIASFTRNFLYTPIDRDEFMAQYGAIRDRIQPELVLIAEENRRPVGFAFAIPNYPEAARGAITTAIVKTIAVLPERRCAGLGAWLVQEAHRAARRLGFLRGIHALMHQSNSSMNISARYGKPFRRYTLFCRPLP